MWKCVSHAVDLLFKLMQSHILHTLLMSKCIEVCVGVCVSGWCVEWLSVQELLMDQICDSIIQDTGR